MNKDIFYNILLKTDIDKLKNSCLTNKTSLQICLDKQFWLERGLAPSIVDLPQNLSDWFKLFEANRIANVLFNLFIMDLEYHRDWIKINIHTKRFYDQINMTLLLSLYKLNEEETEDYLNQKIGITLFKNGDIILDYEYINSQDDKNDVLIFKLTKNVFIDFLTRLLYYYVPSVVIEDQRGYSYISTVLLEEQISNAYFPNRRSYHQVESRIMFLNNHNIFL